MSVRPWSCNGFNAHLPPPVLASGGNGLRLAVPFSGSELAALFGAFRATLNLSGLYVELAFLDEGEMEALNKECMDCAGPTNILSFPALALPCPALPRTTDGNALAEKQATEGSRPPCGLLGSLAFAPETALRESIVYGQEHSLYCIRLFAHGYAHLAGHDHGDVMTDVCEKLEEAALKTLP